MADVFHARDRALDRDVVVKILRAEWQADEHQRDRFQREAKLLAELDSDRLAQVLDVCVSDDQCFIVMRHLSGRNVEQIVNSTGPIEPQIALQIVRDVLGGLQDLHALGLVHRDVKPANVLVGSDDRATLLDLGVVHDRRRPRITPPAHTVGTLNFMSPELRRSSSVDLRSDLYQAGLLLLYMTTAMSPRELDLAALEEALHRGLPRSISTIISRALLPPDTRYATVEEMCHDVDAAMYASTTLELGTQDVIVSTDLMAHDEPILLIAPKRPRSTKQSRSWRQTIVIVAIVALGVWSLDEHLEREFWRGTAPGTEIAAPIIVDLPHTEVLATSTRALPPVIVEAHVAPTKVGDPVRSFASRPEKTRSEAPVAVPEFGVPEEMFGDARIWLERALRHEQNGAREAAIAAYRGFLRIAPDDLIAPRINDRLVVLEAAD